MVLDQNTPFRDKKVSPQAGQNDVEYQPEKQNKQRVDVPAENTGVVQDNVIGDGVKAQGMKQQSAVADQLRRLAQGREDHMEHGIEHACGKQHKKHGQRSVDHSVF